MKKSLLFLASLLLTCLLPASAQEEDGRLQAGVKGFIDTYHAIRTASPGDWMASRSRVRGELTLEKDNAGMFVSANAVHNSLLKDQSGFFLREAYLYYSKSGVDIRAGRQIVTWGVADAMRITDIISPMDFTEFLTQDYDDIRIPVNGVRVRYTRPKWSAEAIVIPVSSFYELSTDNANPWAVNLPDMTIPYSINLDNTPKKQLKNMEYGGRIGAYLSGVDFNLYALRTWNKMPVFRKTIAADGSLLCDGEYRRMTMLGADLSVPLGKFVVRAEAAEYFGEAQEPVIGTSVESPVTGYSAASAPVVTRNSTNALIGVDWYAGNDWQLGLQYSHKYISGDMSGISTFRNAGMATVRISKDLLHSTLSLSTFAYVDVANGGIYNRLYADYALTDQIHALLGYDFFHADKGQFAMYGRNSEVWIKLKYSF